MGWYSGVKYSKCQDLPKFHFGGRGVRGGEWGWGGLGGILESNTQSAKICLNFIFWGMGWYSGVKYSKCQDLPKFHFGWGGGGILESNTQSAKIYLNFILGGGMGVDGGSILDSNTQSAKMFHKFQFLLVVGWGYSGVKFSKWQDLPKFQLIEGGGYSGVKYSKCQDLPKFHFWRRWGWVGWWYSGVKYSKCQDLPKFQLGWGLSGLKFQRGVLWRIWTKIYCLRLVYRNLLVHHR